MFTVGGLTFGIVICNDSNFPGPAQAIAAQGATAVFIPTNTALPTGKADVVADARRADISLATANGLTVIRTDVAGRAEGRQSFGASWVIAPGGSVVRASRPFVEDLVIAELEPNGVSGTESRCTSNPAALPSGCCGRGYAFPQGDHGPAFAARPTDTQRVGWISKPVVGGGGPARSTHTPHTPEFPCKGHPKHQV